MNAEIESLQKYLAAAHREIGQLKHAASEQAAYNSRVIADGRQRIAELEAGIRERDDTTGMLLARNATYRTALKKLGKAKRERGKALVEERARFEYYVQNENCESWPEARRKYPELEKKYIGIAREQLAADHPELFGNSDHIREAPEMGLTGDQWAALEYVIDGIDFGPTKILKALRSLLSGSVRAWEVTEERKAAIQAAVDYYIPPPTQRVLQAMLEEARP